MKMKAVIFDMDGTLIDSMKLILKSVNIAFKHVGLPEISPDMLGTIAGRPLAEILKMLKQDIDAESIRKCEEIFKEVYRTMSAVEMHVFPKVKETLAWLHNKRILLAVVSTTSEQLIERELKRFEFEKFFHVIIGRESVQNFKPSPEGILKALTLLEVRPDETVFVGDSPMDVKAGKKANVKTIAVTTGFSKKEILSREKPDYIINGIDELKNILN